MAYYEAGEDFDVIISDIEMPGMNGFQFAEAVKSSIRWQKTPMVALSSHASTKDLDRGRAVGFDDYVATFDREALLQTLHARTEERRVGKELVSPGKSRGPPDHEKQSEPKQFPNKGQTK